MKPSERIREIYNENKDSPETANMTFPSQYVHAILQHLDERWEAEQKNKNPFIEGMNDAWKKIKPNPDAL